MNKIDAIRERTLSKNAITNINALAARNEEAIENQIPEPPINKPVAPPIVNDVAFYGPRVLDFYQYFQNVSEKDAAALTLAAATLKASVVLGGAIKDLSMIIEHPMITAPTIPVVGKKRGRPRKICGMTK